MNVLTIIRKLNMKIKIKCLSLSALDVDVIQRDTAKLTL